MRDNKTSQPAQQYDGNIRKTMPCYDLFHDSILNLVGAVVHQPQVWLDTGAGTGELVGKAAGRFPRTRFLLADPSAAMLNIAQTKLPITDATYLAVGSEELAYPPDTFDVITAVLAHHYFDAETRRAATDNCFRMLKPGGVYITFETVMPTSDQGRRIGLDVWRQAQLRQGKSEAEAVKYIQRFGV